jgi:hypothetical protein
MKSKNLFMIAVAAVLAFAAANVNLHAQSIGVIIDGSSAIWQELAQASYASYPAGTACIWTTSGNEVTVTDTRAGMGELDYGAAWVTWAATGGTCGTPTAGNVNLYVKTDSVLGDRCYFSNPACSVLINGTTTGSSIPGAGTVSALPTAIENLINNSGSGTPVNAAATDIRPEDALFATNRAFTACNTTVGGSTNYLGLGLPAVTAPNGNTTALAQVSASQQTVGTYNLSGLYTTPNPYSTFNIAKFAISGTDPVTGNAVPAYTVTEVGAQPILVIVNPTDASGTGGLNVTNVDRAVLAGVLDGTYGAVTDIVPQAYSATEVGLNVFLREPVSGTYNTMEYAIPNNIENQSSQDIGLAAAATTGPFPPDYCNAGVWGTLLAKSSDSADASGVGNPLSETDTHTATSTRSRVIGTSQVVKAVENAKDGFGYAFWSQPNFSSATPGNVKYITVDGIDPLQEVWQDGEVPTTGNGLLGNVSFSHIKDGTYPIWSFVRMVSTGATTTIVTNLVSNITAELESYPDFVPVASMPIVRSHFTPPGVTYTVNGGNPSNGDVGHVEAGGDVGGAVYSLQADKDYNNDSGTGNGNVGHRQ